MGKYVFLYVMVLSIPLAFALAAWQSTRYAALQRDIERNTRLQAELVEQNRRLITEIAALSATARIDKLARDIGLDQRQPESVIHVSIEE
ncbi:MAG: cell division protein FtsL [Spirochaetaceae bacterium]|jgi:cell division protein FtsL|nr:cell division protein FtsL [Spirochaetaceae bacterium]